SRGSARAEGCRMCKGTGIRREQRGPDQAIAEIGTFCRGEAGRGGWEKCVRGVSSFWFSDFSRRIGWKVGGGRGGGCGGGGGGVGGRGWVGRGQWSGVGGQGSVVSGRWSGLGGVGTLAGLRMRAGTRIIRC